MKKGENYLCIKKLFMDKINKVFRVFLVVFLAYLAFLLNFYTKSKKSSNDANHSWISRIDQLLNEPEVKAFLDTVSFAEGTFEDGYNTLYAGHKFNDLSDHPRCVISSVAYPNLKKQNKGLQSSAAGRYQILAGTWDKIAVEMNLPNFSPHNQDKAALGLIRQHGALNDVLNGRFEIAIKKLSNLWPSFPGSKYKQPNVPMEKLKAFYINRLMVYKSNKK